MVLELKLKINSTKMQIFNFFFRFFDIFSKNGEEQFQYLRIG